MDYDDLEEICHDPRARLLFLCSPHNPVGRVWTKDELERLGTICAKHNILVVADEIHSDLIFPGHTHVPLASISEQFAANSITCTAPSKTFNMAGLQTANLIIPDSLMRRQLEARLNSNAIQEPNLFGIEATTAAYRDGADWLSQVMEYLDGNACYIEDFIKDRMPEIGYKRPEGTYLAWLDFRKAGFDADSLKSMLVDKAGLALNQGSVFGHGGEGFARLNFACPKSVLKNALEQIEKALDL
jgi:cystathionine beta-lyase